MQYKINATIIKHWYQYGCERKLLYSADKIEKNTQIETVPDNYADSSQHPGTIFEKEVVEILSQSTHVYKPKPNRQDLTSTQWNHFVRNIDGNDTAYAWQPVVYGSSIANLIQLPPNVSLSKGFIDLVRREDKGDHLLLTIIDAKYSPISTHFHKVQVAYYARILGLELEALNEKKAFPKPVQINSVGEIWIPSEEDGVKWSEEVFTLQPYQNELDYFFQHEIRRLSQVQVRPEDQSHFHLYYKCEQCKYHPHCLKSIQKENPEEMDLSAIFGLTQYTKRKLKERGFHTVGDLSTLESDHFEHETLWKLQGAGEHFITRAKALVAKTPIFKEGTRTINMPPTVDCPVILSVDRSANHGFLVSIGLHLKQLDGTVKEEQFTISTKDAERAVLEECLEMIQTLLQDLHDWNSDKTNKDDLKTCQIFTYEASEMRNLKESIATYIDDPDFADTYKLILRILTPEGLIPDPSYNQLNQSLITTLRSTFEQLYAIPSTVTYDLARLSQALETTTSFSGAYIPAEDFAHPFSSQLSMDQVENIIHNRADIDAIKQDLQSRVHTTHLLIEWLMEQSKAATSPFLCLNNTPFIIQEDIHTMNIGGLDGLRSQTVLGTNLSIKGHMHALSKPLEQRVKDGHTWGHLKLVSEPEPNEKKFLLYFETAQTEKCSLGRGAFNLFLHQDNESILLNKRQQGLHKCDIVDIKSNTGNSTYLTIQINNAVYKRLKDNLLVDSTWVIDAGINSINDYRVQTFLASLQ